MVDLVEKVADIIISDSLINKGDKVLCAVSGGADSVVLLHILHLLSVKMQYTIVAAHFNHEIRGNAADSDERFVKEFCTKLGVEYVIGHGDVPKYSKDNGYTLEQAGRILRYEFLEDQNTDKIAVAHHMDDQAESIMMHLIRGSGTTGLCGMRYKRDKIIRPLLCARRNDIEEYAQANCLEFCTDTTNFVPDGTRNKLRLSIIPEITKQINHRFVESLCAMSDIVRKDDDCLNDIAKEKLENSKISENCYNREEISRLDEPIKRRALRIATVSAGAFADIEQKHIEMLEKLLAANTGAVLHLPHIIAWTSYEKIYFSTKEKYVTISSADDYCVKLRSSMYECLGAMTVRCEEISGNSFVNEANTSFMDVDKLPEEAVIRCRKGGDRINPVGASGSKKLKDFFIDKKIERQNRNVPLVCAGNDVLCAVGIAVSKRVMVTEETKRMLKITFELRGN